MKKYIVDDLRQMMNEPKEVEAASAIEAVRKLYPDSEISRDYTNTGDILVKAPYMTRYGRAYKSYVYNIKR